MSDEKRYGVGNSFSTGAILSVVTGRQLCVERGEVTALLEFLQSKYPLTMTDPKDELIPAAKHIIEQLPWSSKVGASLKRHKGKLADWLSKQVEKHGAYHCLPPMPVVVDSPAGIVEHGVDDSCDLLDDDMRAANVALGGLAELSRLAGDGDIGALREFHQIACSMVEWLNEKHHGYAEACDKWPVVLPAERTERTEVIERAKKMRIASVKAGAKGAGEKLSYDSERGFAMEILRRIEFARVLLVHYGEGDMKSLSEVSKIPRFDAALIEGIRGLSDYSSATKGDWIAIMLMTLKLNYQLVPPAINNRSRTIAISGTGSQASANKDESERGGRLRKTLVDGLKHVVAIPPF